MNGESSQPMRTAHLTAELRARLDKLGRVGHEPVTLGLLSICRHEVIEEVEYETHASTAPAVAPAMRECRDFSFFMTDMSEVCKTVLAAGFWDCYVKMNECRN